VSAQPTAPLPDARDRERAATILDRNLVVTAGAGTGKTALLVERALNLIGSGRRKISTLAAITFTEKAAAELRQRLAAGLDALQRLASEEKDPSRLDRKSEAERAYRWLRTCEDVPSESIRSRAAAALTGMDAASISTIHAFCSEILRRFPDTAAVDPSFSVDEGPAFQILFEQEWERFLLAETGPKPSRPDLWRRVLTIPGALGDVRLVGRDMALLGLWEEPGGDGGIDAGMATRLMQELASTERARLMALEAETSGMNPNMVDYLAGAAQLLDDFSTGGPEAMAATRSPKSLDDFQKQGIPAPGKKLEGAEPEEVRKRATAARSLIRLLARVDEERVRLIVEAADPLARRARSRFLASGYVSFDALLQITRNLLAKEPRIRRAQASRLGTILVDEFQDTDPLQYEILFYLAEAKGEDASDPYRTRLAPGRLFIVGDPKQSIYRFRGADMEAYRRAVDHVLACEGEELTLSASFRAPTEIVEPINRLFGAWMSSGSKEDLLYEAAYQPIASASGPSGSAEPLVEIWSVQADGNVEAKRQAEAAAIASWIAAGAGGRPGQVAILLRALTNAGIYAQALRRAGIPYVVEGGRGFYERQEVGDLLAFLRAALTGRDGAAVLAVMRSAVGGVEDAELARFVSAGGRLDGTGVKPDEAASFQGVHRTFRLLEEFRNLMPGRAVDEIVSEALERTNLLLLHASAFEGAQRIANLEKIATRAAEIARRGLSLEETLDFLEREYRDEVAQGEGPLADETVDAVRILSVHKAKGLEYPVVILPDIGRREVSHESRETGAVLVRKEARSLLGAALSGGQINMARAWHSCAGRLHEAAEEKRVFYVACTRASRRLILVNSAEGGARTPWRHALSALGYDTRAGFPPDDVLCEGMVRHRLETGRGMEARGRATEPDPAWQEAAARFQAISRHAAGRSVPPARWPAGAGDQRVAEGDPSSEDEFQPSSRPERPGRLVARLAGTAVHAALEGWDYADAEDLLMLASKEAERAARREEAGAERDGLVREVSQEVTCIVEAFLDSPLPSRLSPFLSGEGDPREDPLASGIREMPVLHRDDVDDDSPCWLGACDLVYRDANGAIVVADYKTDHVEGDPAKAAERYAEQLDVYARALRAALPEEKIRAEVIFVRAGLSVSLESRRD
jgi:ATP-dependent helicase/nuclease subunit A